MADVPLSPRPVRVTPRGLLPPPALCGFLLPPVPVFSVSYAVGSAAGPVAPGMHGTSGTGSGGGSDSGDMDDMDDMPGMGHGGGG